MVTLVLSTVSVISSVFVARITDVSRPLPHALRVLVLRYAVRLLCVTAPPLHPSQSATHSADNTSSSFSEHGVVLNRLLKIHENVKYLLIRPTNYTYMVGKK